MWINEGRRKTFSRRWSGCPFVGAGNMTAPHTYATMCLMANMNAAFIANQLGHSVQMLLSTYAKWINSTSDWTELNKL